jgi:hypothetical protein
MLPPCCAQAHLLPQLPAQEPCSASDAPTYFLAGEELIAVGSSAAAHKETEAALAAVEHSQVSTCCFSSSRLLLVGR